MNKINLGQSRYGDIRELHEIEVGKYSTEGFKKVNYIRVEPTDIENEYKFIDFDGGPMLVVGAELPTKERITSIVFEDGRYLIKTDKYDVKDIQES